MLGGPKKLFGATDGKIAIFGIISTWNLQNCGSDQSFEKYDPLPQTGVSKANKGYWGHKCI